jgi:hypothetical protein
MRYACMLLHVHASQPQLDCSHLPGRPLTLSARATDGSRSMRSGMLLAQLRVVCKQRESAA